MKAPCWNIVSLVLPVVGGVLGAIAISGLGGRGDYAGALGGGVLFLFGLAAVCVLGEAAAVASLVRGERMMWLSILGVLVNGAVILPVLSLLARAD